MPVQATPLNFLTSMLPSSRPFESKIVHLELANNAVIPIHHAVLLRYNPTVSRLITKNDTTSGSGDRMALNLTKFPRPAGHTVVNFLYTGSYEVLYPIDDADSGAIKVTDMKLRFEIYALSRILGLGRVSDNASVDIKMMAAEADDPNFVVDAIRAAYPGDRDKSFEDKINRFREDARRPSARLGYSSLLDIALRRMIDAYAEAMTKLSFTATAGALADTELLADHFSVTVASSKEPTESMMDGDRTESNFEPSPYNDKIVHLKFADDAILTAYHAILVRNEDIAQLITMEEFKIVSDLDSDGNTPVCYDRMIIDFTPFSPPADHALVDYIYRGSYGFPNKINTGTNPQPDQMADLVLRLEAYALARRARVYGLARDIEDAIERVTVFELGVMVLRDAILAAFSKFHGKDPELEKKLEELAVEFKLTGRYSTPGMTSSRWPMVRQDMLMIANGRLEEMMRAYADAVERLVAPADL
ncbi:hypothetical protein VTJ49DRAFT_2577 [Mycothermus thermophilus]|uniref:BTB domain-containing protein n=1 Tax=Humicola insolens TaxID=85995 RepID=A0ABR3VN50_HUMIN